MNRADIICEARAWLGTPWQHQASLRGLATDCVGFVAGVGVVLNLREAQAFFARPECRSYGRQPDAGMMLRLCGELMDAIAPADAQPGDVLLMRMGASPQHLAFLSARGPDRIIHAYATAGRVVEHALDDKWRRRICGAYALRGIEA